MKADEFGTATQQRMHTAGYLTPGQRANLRLSLTGCGNCIHVHDRNGHSLRCVRHGFMVRHMSVCKDFCRPITSRSAP